MAPPPPASPPEPTAAAAELRLLRPDPAERRPEPRPPRRPRRELPPVDQWQRWLDLSG